MSADNVALLIAVAILVVVTWLSRRVWRRCRCGASYCNDCGRRK